MSYTHINGMRSARYPLQGLGRGHGGGGHHGGGFHGGGRRGGFGRRSGWWGGGWGYWPDYYDDYAYAYPVCFGPNGEQILCPAATLSGLGCEGCGGRCGQRQATQGLGCGCTAIRGLGQSANATTVPTTAIVLGVAAAGLLWMYSKPARH